MGRLKRYRAGNSKGLLALFLRAQYTNPCNCAVYNWWYLKRTKGKSTKAILVDLALV